MEEMEMSFILIAAGFLCHLQLVREEKNLLGDSTGGYGTDGEGTGNPFDGDSDDDLVLWSSV